MASKSKAKKNEREAPSSTKSSDELVEAFDRGEDISDYMEMDNAIWKVNVDFPTWMVKALDAEAERLQVPRQSVIKMWIDEKLRDRHARPPLPFGKNAG